MKTEFININDSFNNVLSSLSIISSFFLNNSIGTYCIIFILVTLLSLVLFTHPASYDASIENILDSREDKQIRDNNNCVDLVFAYTGRTEIFVVDKNDRSALRLKAMFPRQPGSYVLRNGTMGFKVRPSHVKTHAGGGLSLNIPTRRLVGAKFIWGVNSRGLPVMGSHDTATGLTALNVLSDV